MFRLTRERIAVSATVAEILYTSLVCDPAAAVGFGQQVVPARMAMSSWPLTVSLPAPPSEEDFVQFGSRMLPDMMTVPPRLMISPLPGTMYCACGEAAFISTTKA